jgi:exodeoxyribonuclease VII small subunit
MAKKKTPTFEELLAEAEEAADALESGELGLEASLARFETGVANLRACARLLSQAEEKVKVLVEESEEAFRLEDLDAEALDEEDE